MYFFDIRIHMYMCLQVCIDIMQHVWLLHMTYVCIDICIPEARGGSKGEGKLRVQTLGVRAT